MKKYINRLLYLRKKLDNIIDQCITQEVLMGKTVNVDDLKESLLYHIDDELYCLRQHR